MTLYACSLYSKSPNYAWTPFVTKSNLRMISTYSNTILHFFYKFIFWRQSWQHCWKPPSTLLQCRWKLRTEKWWRQTPPMVTLFPSTSSMFCLVMKFQARLEPLLSNARPSARPQNVEKSLRTKRGLQSGFTFRIEMIDSFELCTFVSNH